MQAVLDFINNHVRDIFIPLTALALLRVGMCLAQLKREAEAEAAREAATHTLTSDAEELPETNEQNETTEDKGETENG